MRPFQLAGVLLAILAVPAAGQIIPIRTAPIARADAFDIFPSRHFGMGGLSIAVTDTTGDPATNPAAGARITAARVFASPLVYDVTENAGGGSALPLGVVARSGAWFAGGAVALQAVEPAQVAVAPFGSAPLGGQDDTGPARRSAYGFALLGRSWPGSGLSLGGSVLAARRSALDGVDLLYAESESLESSGRVAVFRLGLIGEWAGARSLEAVAVHSRTRMTHDLTYVDLFWDPELQQPVEQRRDERNADHADVWGLHLAHTRPLSAGWRIGWIATANRVSHPRLPRYDGPADGIMDIRSGRGDAHAYDLGVGIATADGPVRLGVDVVYEPIWSRIWGVADTATATLAGGTIPPGGTTLENRLRFSNAVLRLGAGREWRLDRAEQDQAVSVRIGLAARRVDYRLAQFDYRQGAGRDHHERWTEWTPTWGTSLRLGTVEVGYHGSMTYGTQRPGTATPNVTRCFDICLGSLSVIPGPAPRDVSRLAPVRVATQQFFISVPLGDPRQEGGTP